MLFWKKPKIIVLDAFVSVDAIKNLYPIDKTSNFYPQWWKTMAPTYTYQDQFGIELQAATMRHCSGLIDLYKRGVSIPLWTDLKVKTSSDGGWWCNFVSGFGNAMAHDSRQLGGNLENLIHIKLNSPWLIREKTGCQFLYHGHPWNNLSNLGDYFIPPGIVNFKYSNSTEINTFFPKKDTVISIDAGTPMAHLIPLTDNELSVKCHYVTDAEYRNLSLTAGYRSKSVGNYNNKKKILSSKEAKESKCPFGFKK